jgi:hypothetical protein
MYFMLISRVEVSLVQMWSVVELPSNLLLCLEKVELL